MSNLFERTLIIGASVSAAPADRNPAKRFLRGHGHLTGALVHARDGAPGASMLKSLRASLLDDITAVVSVDLLFWDSVMGLSNPRDSRAFLRGFFKEIEKRGLPIILGRVPAVHPLQVHREELNEAIEKECKAYGNARVLPLDKLFERVMIDQGVLIDGRHHPLGDLIPDGLHPGPVAAEFIAREINQQALSLLATDAAASSVG